ncbi:HD-GYP domain-containing protein [Shewanella sp. YIC-542]|uniref:HD-GYP domain-containing protein n=1 Tax=Shewanella mytili TaxID=3377111 RepID=UPI00398F1923
MEKSRYVPVHLLQVGNYVRLPLSWKDHPFLFSSFKLKAAAQIEMLKKLGINELYVDLDRSDTPPLTEAPTTPPVAETEQDLTQLQAHMAQCKKERIEIQQRMRRELQKTESHFSRSLARMRNLVGKLQKRPLNAIDEAKELIADITQELLASDNLVLHLMSDQEKGHDLYFHSLNITVLSMLLAKELQWGNSEIQAVGLGALLHDIGKLKLPSQILRKQTPFTKPEQNLYNHHPILSHNFLKLVPDFPVIAAEVVINHHEHLDGSGTPRGLNAEQLSDAAQLVAVVNYYDTLCHPNRQYPAKTPYAALSYLYKHSKGKFNQGYVAKMIKMLGIYPPGSIVELSSGQFGLVMSVNLQNILLPSILIYDPLVPKEQAPIVELESEELRIERCVTPAALPDNIYKYLNPRERISYYFGHRE